MRLKEHSNGCMCANCQDQFPVDNIDGYASGYELAPTPDQEIPSDQLNDPNFIASIITQVLQQLGDEGTLEEDPEHVESHPLGAFNCIPLYLDEDILEQLQELVEKDELPECEGGFFWGHQFQDESAKEYKKQDLEFCKWAIDATRNGHSVYYKCWF